MRAAVIRVVMTVPMTSIPRLAIMAIAVARDLRLRTITAVITEVARSTSVEHPITPSIADTRQKSGMIKSPRGR